MTSKTIHIDGVIGSGDGEISAQWVRSQLPPNGTDPIVVKLHSEGGSVFEGFAIHDLLKSYAGPKAASIQSTAFSIASFIAMAFDDIEIAPNGYMMLHNPSVEAQGDDEALAKSSAMLGQLKSTMIDAYAKRSGRSPDEIAAILKAETYYSAQEAVSAGFADRITGTAVAARPFARLDTLPHGVVAALFGAAPGGEHRETKRENLMSSQPVAATVQEIKTAYPKAKSDFIVRCLERQLPMASVASEIVEEVTTENETLAAQVAAMEEELKAARAQLDELAARAKSMDGSEEETARAQDDEEQARAQDDDEQAKAKARKTGASPVARRPGTGGSPSAKAQWSTAVAAKIAAGLPKSKAVSLVNKENPGLREKMLKEVNGR